MHEVIQQKFDLWTKNLSQRDARINVFKQIRDIPYYLVPQIQDPYEWAASIVIADKGSCSPKHYLLGLLFGKLGIPVKYATYPFKWGVQPIRYPEELRKLAEGSPVGNHLALKARIDNRWVLVDATWDSALENAGFAVNKQWDGVSDTFNAVMPMEEIVHENIQERLDLVALKKSLVSENDRAIYAKFIEGFNLWLAALRQEPR